MFFEWLKAILYGLLEGVTEWLPISSTGHLILLYDRLPFAFSKDPVLLSEFWEFFEVAVQLGAVLALPVLFYKEIFPPKKDALAIEKANWKKLWGRVIVASIPAAFAGILFDKALEHLTGKDLQGWLYRPVVVAVSLILYGIAFLLFDRPGRTIAIESVEEISGKKAFLIGGFQALSLIPGTSRSGSTIPGGITLGIDRATASKFSFFLAIPAIFGASAIKAIGFFGYLQGSQTVLPPVAWGLLLTGCLVSFVLSVCIIRLLLNFVKNHSFRVFGIYRILLGGIVLLTSLWKGGS